jgi:hypothetical protein
MIDQSLITESFAVPSLAGLGGLGQLFNSANVSSWGVGEWAVLLGAGYLTVKLVQDTRSIGSKAVRHGKRLKRGAKKAGVSAASTVGTLAIVAGISAAGYLIYTASQGTS